MAATSLRRTRAGSCGALAGAIEEAAEELARLEARNVGKPISDARGEVGMVANVFGYYAGAPNGCSGTRSRSRAAST